ncbi:hypothetical protein, variant [Aphanomyces astaci]|nr:hypothetical protein, variant [Aphanomyces astaci]ETV72951.1 hypothetical protein, variant [Aphanomyces astaci]|eukprot:XP_009837737.1 hypothetical protein, variant [Aphanomyces astaci]
MAAIARRVANLVRNATNSKHDRGHKHGKCKHVAGQEESGHERAIVFDQVLQRSIRAVVRADFAVVDKHNRILLRILANRLVNERVRAQVARVAAHDLRLVDRRVKVHKRHRATQQHDRQARPVQLVAQQRLDAFFVRRLGAEGIHRIRNRRADGKGHGQYDEQPAVRFLLLRIRQGREA